MEVLALLSQGRTAAAQCGLFTHKSVTVIFEPPCIFIYFSSLHISSNHVPIIRNKLLYLCDTGICHSVWVASGLLVGLKSNQQTRRHPYRVTNTSVAYVQ